MEHAITAKSDGSFQTIEIKFIPVKKEIIGVINEFPYQMKEVDSIIQLIMKELVREALKKEIYYEDMINIQFGEVILTIIRQIAKERENTMPHTADGMKLYNNPDRNVFEEVVK